METLRAQFLSHIAQTSPSPLMIEVERAEGVFLYSSSGDRYFDLISGVSVSNVGHGRREIRDAIKAQVDSYMHTMVYGETVQRVQVEYARRLVEFMPDGIDSVYFVNSGSEAIEGAMKLAKRATGRSEIISMVGAYHGSTQGALSIQGGEQYKSAFRPLLPDTRQIEFNSFADLDLITERTACVVSEVIQGEAGVRLPQPGYLSALERRCREVGALLVVDEVQTGFGRSGEMFASIKYGIKPDIICLAKALGGGLPLGAFCAGKELMDSLMSNPVLGHITTFGGNPVCCASGLAMLNCIATEGLCERASEMGELFERTLLGVLPGLEIRRSGLLLAVELGCSERLMEVMSQFVVRGIMSDWFLFCDTAFRISPPLVISADEVLEVCDIIGKILKS